MSNHPPDYYAILKVGRTATGQEIARAYRALMRVHHPDVERGTSEEGTSRLLGIMEAFAVLRDPKTRAEYDRTLRPVQPAPSAPRQATARQVPVRQVPVRHVQPKQPPLLRVTPVRWERGPGRGSNDKQS
ncbi:J domain-containing protein [Arthrobacter sp. ISL-72]|uniref:J domain-containing protein n=1 Tax=Arthrobacter sp. ISL-72 TaxID=2819114 RepID=UPI001BEC898F|nr:J domain-containing protein [Arthrobacter sp. ISL-72]MBT2596711.1 J domain-containing protein [Arthrobacter sp. ISL-72]